jgi:hypothetical protein
VIVDDKEVSRVPTAPWLLVKKYLIVDWAYRANENPATPGQTYDMVVDWIEVQQKETDLAVVPKFFTARPTLTGTRGAGQTVTCSPKVTASQIEYRWYRNGEPILGATAATYVQTSADTGKALRCHVRAASLLDQPEAWSAAMP